MKATLEFDLLDPDGRMDHMRCIKSLDMALVLWEIETRLRDRCQSILSRLAEDSGATPQLGMEVVLEQIRDIMHERNINLDEIIC